MKIIAAGFSKTGTKSLAIALDELGYGVYDMLEHYWYHGEEWRKILVEGSDDVVKDFKKMYQDVDAVLDCPAFLFWEEILEAFPDAKIILTTRDAEKWYKSWHKQTIEINGDFLYKLMQTISPSGRKFFQHLKVYCPPVFGFALETPWRTIPINKEILIQRYKQHYQNVLQNAPKDKILVYNIKDGWQPLCKFLDKKVPNAPFPHENKGGEVIKLFLKKNPIMKRIFTETVVAGFLLLLTGVVLSIFLYKVW